LGEGKLSSSMVLQEYRDHSNRHIKTPKMLQKTVEEKYFDISTSKHFILYGIPKIISKNNDFEFLSGDTVS
jgi:hypothetical protein